MNSSTLSPAKHQVPGTFWNIIAQAMSQERIWGCAAHEWALTLIERMDLWPLRIAKHPRGIRTTPYTLPPFAQGKRTWLTLAVTPNVWALIQAWRPSQATPVDPLDAVSAWLSDNIGWREKAPRLHAHFRRTCEVQLPLVGPRGLEPVLTLGLREQAHRYLNQGAKLALWYQLDRRGATLGRETLVRRILEGVDDPTAGMDLPHRLCGEFRQFARITRNAFNLSNMLPQ